MKTILLLLFTLICTPSFAAEGKTMFLSDAEMAKHKFTITRLEKYLTGLTTIISDFIQVAPDSSIASGKFYLQRPGKMRWQYNPPTPVLMVANGSELVFYDYELEQVSHFPLDGTLISFLGRDKITFGGDIAITKIDHDANAIRVEVTQRAKPTEGKLEFEFSDNPLTLHNFVVTDATGQITTISLQEAKFGVPIDPTLFVFRDPRKARKK